MSNTREIEMNSLPSEVHTPGEVKVDISTGDDGRGLERPPWCDSFWVQFWGARSLPVMPWGRASWCHRAVARKACAKCGMLGKQKKVLLSGWTGTWGTDGTWPWRQSQVFRWRKNLVIHCVEVGGVVWTTKRTWNCLGRRHDMLNQVVDGAWISKKL